MFMPASCGHFFMDNLWSPWRSEYIERHAAEHGSHRSDEPEHCFLCKAVSAETFSINNLVVAKTGHTVVILNKFPYNAGHLLIAPFSHVAELHMLNSGEYTDLMDVLRQSCSILNSVLKPHGFNIGANIGVDAGAGVPAHLHIHVVPRWRGDTNFMPTLAEIKVVSESLTTTWQQFSQAFSSLRQQ